MSNSWSIHSCGKRLYVHVLDMVDTAFSCGRILIVYWFLQESFKVKESSSIKSEMQIGLLRLYLVRQVYEVQPILGTLGGTLLLIIITVNYEKFSMCHTNTVNVNTVQKNWKYQIVFIFYYRNFIFYEYWPMHWMRQKALSRPHWG